MKLGTAQQIRLLTHASEQLGEGARRSLDPRDIEGALKPFTALKSAELAVAEVIDANAPSTRLHAQLSLIHAGIVQASDGAELLVLQAAATGPTSKVASASQVTSQQIWKWSEALAAMRNTLIDGTIETQQMPPPPGATTETTLALVEIRKPLRALVAVMPNKYRQEGTISGDVARTMSDRAIVARQAIAQGNVGTELAQAEHLDTVLRRLTAATDATHVATTIHDARTISTVIRAIDNHVDALPLLDGIDERFPLWATEQLRAAGSSVGPDGFDDAQRRALVHVALDAMDEGAHQVLEAGTYRMFSGRLTRWADPEAAGAGARRALEHAALLQRTVAGLSGDEYAAAASVLRRQADELVAITKPAPAKRVRTDDRRPNVQPLSLATIESSVDTGPLRRLVKSHDAAAHATGEGRVGELQATFAAMDSVGDGA